ncbi:MAG: hypothetical protein ABSG22_10610 [Sedimentisphaerales bacterium]
MRRINKITIIIAGVIAALAILWVASAMADDKALTTYNQLTYIGDAKFGYLYIIDITANDTQPTFGTKTWADVIANTRTADGTVTGTGRWLAMPNQWALAEVSIFAHAINKANDANAGAFDVNAFAIRKYGGVKKVFSGPVGIGNVQLSNNPYSGAALRGTAAAPVADPNYKWADEMTLSYQWPLGVYKGGYSGTETYGDILQLVFPVAGYEYFGIFINNANWTVIDHIYIILSGASGG